MEGPGLRGDRGEQQAHAQGLGRSTTYGKVAEAAAKLDAPKDVKLKTRRTGRSPASRSSASTPRTR